MFRDFDLAIRKDYQWPTRKPVRAPCIRPSPDIAGNRVGMGRPRAPNRRPHKTCTLNYESLINIYFARKNHKLDEWNSFCDWISTLPYADELIINTDKAVD